jgi:hypothetical protein
MKYGFFVVMGGVGVSVQDIYDKREMVVLTAEAVRNLAENKKHIKFPAPRIEDKSKAGIMEKALVILQVLWMVLQCLARRCYGLPLSLLEIHTIVHVVIAILMYSFWFYISHKRLFSGLILIETCRNHMTLKILSLWIRPRSRVSSQKWLLKIFTLLNTDESMFSPHPILKDITLFCLNWFPKDNKRNLIGYSNRPISR